MKIVNILTEGPISYNGRAFLQPILLNKNRIKEYSININFYKQIALDLTDCDLLIVDSKFFQSWWLERKQEMLDLMEKFHEHCNVIFFDTSDSAGFLLGDILPYVKSYYKHQILKDKEHYLKPMYGRRLFSDYYHKHNNVEDGDHAEENIIQVSNNKFLDKIKVSWNTGLANYSFSGEYLGKLYRKLPIKGLLRYPRKFTTPSRERLIDVQCRFNTFYAKDSVAYQRKEIAKILHKSLQTKKINRYSFFNELKQSKIVLSPFGLGEITLKDFEVFLMGALLMKPDMSHLKTWPDFYNKETYVSFNWNLSDLLEKIEFLLDNYSNQIEIAKHGQNIYQYYVSSESGYEEFISRLVNIIENELIAK